MGARRAAERILDGVPSAIARTAPHCFVSIGRHALRHLPAKFRDLALHYYIENLCQPHPFDNEPPGG